MATLRAGRYLEASFDSVGELSREDLAVLQKPRERLPAAIRFRDSHHRIARLFASGMTLAQVHERCGYSMTRLSVLRNDPAFDELVAEYRKDVNESWKENIDEYYGLRVANMVEAELQIEEQFARARDEGTTLPLKTLLAYSSDSADRFGYGKKSSKDVNLNVDFADRLQKAISRSGKVIEHAPLPRMGAGAGGSTPIALTVSAPPKILRRA